ncbi:hypothetical protein BIFPSEUDO_03389 [Bifidobacterium pseudocatenulatum DSM 20438 = JCM 1200 = LMG 10505]|uniref:Uncharacterized protein n=1 Tax=Bifidobacterium pseudocatenulatum DSM 20438 = JCM 1200 = LMG 10505 TaxID=547043 RepID=C0BRX4_BIFPS|nr:hypothetical protein BIFPSEUDO_03389 [Bifidobacterium pseudocatenulatum DSM 20438 = JCM 1200 = LMG 10505]
MKASNSADVIPLLFSSHIKLSYRGHRPFRNASHNDAVGRT